MDCGFTIGRGGVSNRNGADCEVLPIEEGGYWTDLLSPLLLVLNKGADSKDG